MRMLLVAPKSEFTFGIQRALQKREIEVVYLNERLNYLVPGFLRENEFLWKMMIRHSDSLKLKNKAKFNKVILELCAKEKFDSIVTTKGTTMSADTLGQLRTTGTRSVNWWIENMYHRLYAPWVKKHFVNFDYFLAFDSAGVQELQQLPHTNRVDFLPLAIEPELYSVEIENQNDKKKYECDVCFAGARYPEREDLLTAVAQLGVRLKIFGWPQWKESPLAKYYGGPLTMREMAKAYHYAKISLNCNLWPAKGSVNLKTFEIPASGGFELCDYQPDLRRLFKVDKEIVSYSTKEEMITKVSYYVDHVSERIAIAKAGYDRVLRDHTLDRRVEQILKIIA